MPEPFVASPGTDLLDLAWFPSPTWPEDLANIAQPEDWDDEGSGRHPILVNYLRYTARRLLEEKKWLQTTEEGNRVSAFNTGLLSRDYFEPVYAIFEQNRNVEKQPWVHKEWAVPSSPRLRPFSSVELEQAMYFERPGEAVFDPRLPVVPRTQHIVNDHVDRYPPDLRDNTYMRGAMLEKAIKVAAAKAKANWRLSAPQFFWPSGGTEPGRLQLLLPLALIEPDRVDLALVIDRDPSLADQSGVVGARYLAYTVLPLEWAYRNARLITRPEASWLDRNVRAAVGDSRAGNEVSWSPAD